MAYATVLASGAGFAWHQGRGAGLWGAAGNAGANGKLKPSRRILVGAHTDEDYLKFYHPDTYWQSYAPGEVRMIDLDEAGNIGGFRSAKIRSFLHGVMPNPVNKRDVVGCEKWGLGAARIDIVDGRVIGEYQAPAGSRFFGHADFLPDGKHVLISSSRNDDNRGFILLYEYESMKLLDRFPSNDLFPHDLYVEPGGKWAAFANEGRKFNQAGSLGFLDVGSGKISELHPLGMSPSHFCRLGGDQFVIGGNAQGKNGACNVFLYDARTRERRSYATATGYTGPRGGDVLSVIAISETTCAVTMPQAYTLLVWDTAKNLVREHPLPAYPLGVSRSAAGLYVSTIAPTVELISPANLFAENAARAAGPATFGNGRHIALVELA